MPFDVWFEYMVENGYLSDTANKSLMLMAWNAGIEYEAACEGIGSEPRWMTEVWYKDA